MRRSSSAPAETTCPGCALRTEITPASGARSVAKPSRSFAASRSASAAATWATARARLARSSSRLALEMRLLAISDSPRVACAVARSRLARACARLASACRACTSSVRRSSSSSGWPAATRAPGSTSTEAMRRPVSSTPSDISCHAATEPEAVTSRSTLRRAAVAVVTVMEAAAAAGFAGRPSPQAASANSGAHASSRSSDEGRAGREAVAMATRYAGGWDDATLPGLLTEARPEPAAAPRNRHGYGRCGRSPAAASAG